MLHYKIMKSYEPNSHRSSVKEVKIINNSLEFMKSFVAASAKCSCSLRSGDNPDLQVGGMELQSCFKSTLPHD